MANTKTALITGANRGIGLELARHYIALGYTVYAGARKPQASAELKALQEKHPQQCHLLAIDVSSRDSVAQAREMFTRPTLDVLINNAGVLLDRGQKLADVDPALLFDTYSVNVIGPILVTQAFLGKLHASHSPKVITISSMMGSITDNKSGGYYGYRTSKAAVNMFNKSLSVDEPRLTCLVMHPGWVKTDMGGPQAQTEIAESVKGLVQVIEKATLSESGKFFDFKGKELPW